MVKKIVRWECEGCKAKYQTRAKARKCQSQKIPDDLPIGSVFQEIHRNGPKVRKSFTIVTGKPILFERYHLKQYRYSETGRFMEMRRDAKEYAPTFLYYSSDRSSAYWMASADNRSIFESPKGSTRRLRDSEVAKMCRENEFFARDFARITKETRGVVR